MKKLLLLFLLSFGFISLAYADNELSPSKKQCNDLFKNQVVVNNIQHYINLHADANYDVKDNRLY